MIRGRWDEKAELFLVEEHTGNRWRILAVMSRDDAVEFTEECQVQCNRAWGVTEEDLADQDDLIALGHASPDDADLPHVVRLADGSARVDLEFHERR